MLSEYDLAALTNRLQIPLVAQDVLKGREKLDDEMQVCLHEILSNFQPDSALLAIAISARKIAAHFQHLDANMVIMKMECDRFIAEYAELWLRNAQARPIDNNLVFETLINLPEDLEVLSDSLLIAADLLQNRSKAASKLCEILAMQAQNHAIIAEKFAEIMETEKESRNKINAANDDMRIPHPVIIRATYTDNIIPFPARTRKTAA
ncbi:MAG: hypothetical protein KDI46_02370 [Alphaproteobacteria bacterium]|nr:hypothetical protein [Alphaproteobacteria bacterium]